MLSDCVREIREEIYTAQEEIIERHASAIHKLITMINRYTDIKEADLASAKEDIDAAAMMREEYGL